MKKFQKLTMTLVLLIMAATGAWAQDNTCGNGVTWSLTDGVLTISKTGDGDGKMADYRGQSGPWGKDITKVTIGEGVTSIGYGAFSYCSKLTDVTIGSSVTTIGEDSFNGCSKLTDLTIPSSVTSIGGNAFCSCSKLTDVTIGSSVTTIGSHAFYDCTSLTEITIPSSVTSIVYEAFSRCSGLTTVIVEAESAALGVYAFMSFDGDKGSYEILPNLTAIYVPADKVDAYKEAENWSDYKEYIMAITYFTATLAEGTDDADKWNIEPAEAKTTGVTAGTTLTLTYSGTREVKSVKAVQKVVNLSKVTADLVLKDGDIITGTLNAKVKITIADGATVTLRGASISGSSNTKYKWAGLNCAGDATIILADGSENTVKGFYTDYPGIYVPQSKTLTIKGESAGTGKLTASSNGRGCGIGCGYEGINCGNIAIEGGVIEATGGQFAAGIGSAYSSSCVNITISGGTVIANGGQIAAGIGTGNNGTCTSVTISGEDTKVTATKGSNAPFSIAATTVTIGGSKTDNIPTSPYTYPAPSYTMAANAVAGDVGKLICTDGHIHAYNADAACTKSRVAKIIYVGSSTGDATYNHGLALALTDEGSSGMAWEAAKTACTNKNTSATVKSASWMLPSKTQWETMGACMTEGSPYPTLRDGFTSVGGSNLKSVNYWSSTEDDSNTDRARMFDFANGFWMAKFKDEGDPLVRACLAF